MGCVLSPPLFDVFFTATIPPSHETESSDDEDILADLAHLQEDPANVGPDTALACA